MILVLYDVAISDSDQRTSAPESDSDQKPSLYDQVSVIPRFWITTWQTLWAGGWVYYSLKEFTTSRT